VLALSRSIISFKSQDHPCTAQPLLMLLLLMVTAMAFTTLINNASAQTPEHQALP